MRLALLWHQNLMDTGATAEHGVIRETPFRDIMDGRDRTGPLRPPWAPKKRQGFWERYLPHWETLAQVPGRNAWRARVPLRAEIPLAVDPGRQGVDACGEGFFHPWGVTFVVDLTLRGSWAGLEVAAEDVLALRSDPCFSLDGGGSWLSLDQLARAGLEKLRAIAGKDGGAPIADPFSVFTLNVAKGEPGSYDPAHEDVARFLQATSSFSPTWKTDDPVTSGDATVARKSDSPPTHLTYGRRRGRAIWSPEHFLAGGGVMRPSTLECHHHNLVLASVQTEALSRLAIAIAARIQANADRDPDERTQTKWAMTALGKLYEGDEMTYRSKSVAAQVGMNDWLVPINVVRVESGLPAIAAAQPSG
jgi:hypothetical protein